MARLKEDPNKLGFIEQIIQDQERLKEESPITAERWFVVDYLPRRKAPWNYEEEWLDAEWNTCSPYFPTRELAESWQSLHDPEPGAKLVVFHENLRVFTTEKWVNW